MTILSPNEFLQHVEDLERQMRKAQKTEVAVGITNDQATSAVYKSGINVLFNGSIHEFGWGNATQRSFLRVPFDINKDQIIDAIDKEWVRVVDGRADVDEALGRIGLVAENISKGAFTSRGYGTWPDIKQSTKEAKGSSQTLIDTGTLRRAVRHVVRPRTD